jgi:hypothetical protein
MASSIGSEPLCSSECGALGNMIDDNSQIAEDAPKVSVRNRSCWGTLLRGRLTRLMRLSVCVSHVSTRGPSTIVGFDRGAKAAADAGSSCKGIAVSSSDTALGCVYVVWTGGRCDAMRCDGTDSGGYCLFPSDIGPTGQRRKSRGLPAV